MANEQQLPEIKMDATALYREEVFTDRRAGTLRRMVPVTQSGDPDLSRPVFFSGQTQLLTPGGVLPLMFEIEAADKPGQPGAHSAPSRAGSNADAATLARFASILRQ